MSVKKIVIPDKFKHLVEGRSSFLDRADVRLFTARTREEQLDIHRDEKVNLIITGRDTPGISCERFCSLIRENEELKKVSIIVVNSIDDDNFDGIRCKANSFLQGPLEPVALFDEAQRLLNISKREAYRALLSVRVKGDYGKECFLCHSENISSSGMLIETDVILGKGEAITCSFFLPSSVQITAECQIVRVAGAVSEYDTNQYGVRFLDLPAALRSEIENFVEKHSADLHKRRIIEL